MSINNIASNQADTINKVAKTVGETVKTSGVETKDATIFPEQTNTNTSHATDIDKVKKEDLYEFQEAIKEVRKKAAKEEINAINEEKKSDSKNEEKKSGSKKGNIFGAIFGTIIAGIPGGIVGWFLGGKL